MNGGLTARLTVRLGGVVMLLVSGGAMSADAVFHASFDSGVNGVDAAGNAVAPVRQENVRFAEGLNGQALVAESARVVYPASVIPSDTGTVEVVVSPLESGLGKSWMAFCGDAESWGTVGVPRLWRWNGAPRFDLDGGRLLVTAGEPDWFDWSVGTWHVFTGTWDRAAGRVRFFVDGRMIGTKFVDGWTNQPSAGFAVGYGVHIDNTSTNWARALIDSVTVFDAPLSAVEIQRRARQMGITQLSVTNRGAHPDWRNALAPGGEAGPEVTLALDGEAACRIVIPAEPTTVEQKAAVDLADWLGVMIGGRFEIVTEDAAASGPVISVGATARLARAGLPSESSDLGREGYGIGVSDGDLLLWGGSGRGPINAVYALLEEDLGCRWYHRDSVMIPERRTLSFRPVPRTFVPALEIRDPYYWDAFHADWSLRNRTNAPSARVSDEFGGRVRYAGGFFVHTFNRLVPPKTYFEEHPEYYSEIGGKRQPRQLCLTNPEVLRISIDKVKDVLRADPTAQLISVSPNDGRGYCECAECGALDEKEGGTHAATLLAFVNAVAEAIAEEFPSTIRPRANVVIRLCTDRHAWSHFFEFVTETDAFSTAMRAWAEVGAQIHIWDYTVNFSHYSLPQPNMPVVTQNIRWMMNHNARGIMLQGAYQGPGSARGPLRSWVWAKQLWDPSLNTRDLIRDFTYGFYGEAAEPMQAYNELLWRVWEEEYMGLLRAKGMNIRYAPDSAFLTREFAAEATRLFARAESLAADGEIRRRVALAKFALLYLKLCRGPGFVAGDDYGALCDEFAATAKREGINRLWEDWRSKESHVEKKLAYWRGLVAASDASFDYLRVGPDAMFCPDPAGVGTEEGWFRPEFADLEWARIACGEPGGWTKQGFPDLTGDAWYRVRFDVPPGFGKDRKIRLFIGAADEDCFVYLNGTLVLDHSCEATGLTPEQIWEKPILFDPGDVLKEGGENLLALRVHNRLGMGGVWKPIYLLAVDEEPDPGLVVDMVRLKSKRGE
jgi:hypothetical protein